MKHTESSAVRLWARRGKATSVAVRQLPRRVAEVAWPLWAKGLRAVKREGEAGVGDTIERLVGKWNSQVFKTWYLKTFGKQCGCSRRKEHLNKSYPYEIKQNP